MYHAEASFDSSCRITFGTPEYKTKPPTNIQGGMFLDRPDLWIKTHKTKKAKPVPPEQLELLKVRK